MADEQMYLVKPTRLDHWLASICRTLRDFRRQCRVTPELRERCVDYALRAGAKDVWRIKQDAEELIGFIAQGKRY